MRFPLSKDPRLNAAEAEKLLIDNGFNLIEQRETIEFICKEIKE